MFQIVFDFCDASMDGRDLHLFVRCIDRRPRFVVAVEEREQAVVFLLRNGVVFVIVALGALDGQAEHRLSDGVHAVEHRVHAKLLGIDGALLVEHGIAQEAGGHDLILVGVRQLVAGKLLDEELVVGQITVEGVDHVIAVEMDLARHVLLVTVGIRVAGGVQPVPSPAFAVVR